MDRSRKRQRDLAQGEWRTSALVAEGEKEDERAVAGQSLFDMLVSMKQRGKLSAKHACLLAHYATVAGAEGPCQRLGKPDGLQSGKYSQHFDAIVGAPKDQNYYNVNVPQTLRHAEKRTIVAYPLQLPHEILAQEFASRGEDMEREMKNHDFPPAVLAHPVNREPPPPIASSTVFPFGLYVDGVSFGRREDTAIGFWLWEVCTDKRWLLTALRKSDLCDCGCKGWCSFWPIWSALEWSLQAMRAGYYPRQRHDGADFGKDLARQSLGDSSLGCRGSVVAIRADWSELAGTFGLPSWKDADHPCPFCTCTTANMFDWHGVTLAAFPWSAKTHLEYDEACIDCEVPVELSHEAWRKLRALLDIHQSDSGNSARGRSLTVDVPELGLCKGDRLDPSFDCPDICSGFDESRPARCVFWRRNEESLARRRNPLFNPALGTDIASACGGDWLHTISLGVLRRWNGWLVWALIRGNAWNIPKNSLGALAKASIPRLSAELFAWYRSEHAQGRDHTRVSFLKRGMLGPLATPSLKLFGSEANSFLKFTAALIERHEARYQSIKKKLLSLPRHELVISRFECHVSRLNAVAWKSQVFRHSTTWVVNGLRKKRFLRAVKIIGSGPQVALRAVVDVGACKAVQSHLQTWVHLTQLPEHRFGMGPERAQQLLDAYTGAMRGIEALHIPCTPKFHLWLHITAATLTKGPPHLWGCWLDEDLNASLKSVAVASRSCRRELWAARVIHGTDAELQRRFA